MLLILIFVFAIAPISIELFMHDNALLVPCQLNTTPVLSIPCPTWRFPNPELLGLTTTPVSDTHQLD